MKLTTPTALTLLALSLVGCSGMTPPNATDMAKIPTVRFGDDAPVGKEFALLYPAGMPLPVLASVNGTLLAQSDQATLHVTLKNDVYVFKNWVSFDGKVWQRSDTLLGSKFEVEVPGVRDGKNAGKLAAEFNLK
jgi:hypothetical protein